MADSTEPPAPPAPEAEESTRVGERNRVADRQLELLRDQRKELLAQADLFSMQLEILKGIGGTFSEREQLQAKLVEYNVRLQELNRAIGDDTKQIFELEKAKSKIQDEIGKKRLKEVGYQKAANELLVSTMHQIAVLDAEKRDNAASFSKEQEEQLSTLEDLRDTIITINLKQEEQEQIKKRIANIEKESLKTEKARIKQQLESKVPGLESFVRFRKLQQAEGVGSAVKQMGSLAGLQSLEGLMNGISGLTSALGPLTSVAGIVQKLVEGFIAFREDQVDLNRVILGNREAGKIYDEMASDIGYATELSVQHGLALTDVKETMISMYKENSAFQHLIETSSRENIKDLTHLATTFKNLELSAADVAKVMDITTRNMQMSATETAAFLEDVKDRASKAGQTVSQYVSNFTSQLPQLRIYGDNSVKIFNRINKQAQNTGASIAGIMNIGKQFETYESAATTATKLNMILGSNFDALKAISASPDEMVDMIRGQISPSDLESMGHLQRKYLSGVLGIEYDQLERIVQGKDIEKDKSPAAMMGNIVKDTDRIGNLLENIARSIGALAQGILSSPFFGGMVDSSAESDFGFTNKQVAKLRAANTQKVERKIGKDFADQIRNITSGGEREQKRIQEAFLDIVSQKKAEGKLELPDNFTKVMDKYLKEIAISRGADASSINKLIELLTNNGIRVHGNVNANLQEVS